MMLTLNHVSYIHTNKDLLLDNIQLSIQNKNKVALIGNNGTGKSTLLKIMAGELKPSQGTVTFVSKPYHVPQHVGQFDDYSVAQALHVHDKLNALQQIDEGLATEDLLVLLNDDWLLAERCREAFSQWQLEEVDLNRKMGTLSGGQKTKVFLAGITIHEPAIVLLDEPTNHLDLSAREKLYAYLKTTSQTLVVVSHDKRLLNELNIIHELSTRGITTYGGNYHFYMEAKKTEAEALEQNLKSAEKALRKAKEIEREAMERKQKLDARGKKKQEKAGLPTISMNTFKNKAEKSTSRLKDVHNEKILSISEELSEIRMSLPVTDKIKLNLDRSRLHKGKKLMTAHQVNFGYNNNRLWQQPFDFHIQHGERIALIGRNGSGKTTLIKMILEEVQPLSGTIERVKFRSIYIDQNYSLIHDDLKIYEQVQLYNEEKLQEHELKIRLHRFLFGPNYWDKPCGTLSGGEKMRLLLCCLMIGNKAPDMIVLDEPTNNLDIQNVDILTRSVAEFTGTLIVVSHDEVFLKNVRVDREIALMD